MLIGQTSSAPSIVSLPDLPAIAIAYRDVNSNHIQVSVTPTINLGALGQLFTSNQTTDCNPSLAYMDSPPYPRRLFIAWKGDGNTGINVGELQLNGSLTGNTFFVSQMLNFIVLPKEETITSPTITAYGDQIMLAFIGLQGNINIMLSNHLNVNTGTYLTDPLIGFSNKFVFNDRTRLPVGLAVTKSRGAYVAWSDGGDALNMAQYDPTNPSAKAKVISVQRTWCAPALTYVGSTDRLLVAWTGIWTTGANGSGNLNIWRENGWSPNPLPAGVGFHLFLSDNSQTSPSICVYQDIQGIDQIALAWKGSNNPGLNLESVFWTWPPL